MKLIALQPHLRLLCKLFCMEGRQGCYCGSSLSGLTPDVSRTGRHALLQSRSPPPRSTTSLQLLRITSAAGRGTPKAFPKAFACSMSLVPFTRGWPGSCAVLTKLSFVMFVPAGANIHALQTHLAECNAYRINKSEQFAIVQELKKLRTSVRIWSKSSCPQLHRKMHSIVMACVGPTSLHTSICSTEAWQPPCACLPTRFCEAGFE